MPPKSKKSREDRLIKQRLCQKRRYAAIKNDPELFAVEKDKRRQKYLKKKAENNLAKSTRTVKEQRIKWKENSKRYRQRKKEVKPPKFEAVQAKAINSDQDAVNSSDTSFVNEEDPLKVNGAAIQLAIKKVRYEESKKIIRLLSLLISYKKKNKAQTKQIQRLRKLLKYSRQMNKINFLDTVSNADSLVSQSNTCAITADNRNQLETSSKNKKVSLIQSIKSFYLQDANSVQCECKKHILRKIRYKCKNGTYACL